MIRAGKDNYKKFESSFTIPDKMKKPRLKRTGVFNFIYRYV